MKPKKVLLPKGDVFRLTLGPNVEKGKWYIGVFCKGCEKPIYLLDDTGNGRYPKLFVGEGHITTPCPRCYTDVKYAATDLISMKAEETILRRMPRREPSNMARQPLYKKYPRVKPTFGPGFLERRPEAGALIARCIALWSDVEAELARLLATLLHANTEPAIAVFLAIQSSRAQTAVLDAAAKVVLNEKDYELFGALMIITSSVEKERNALAHGRYGGSDQVPDGILWINSVDLTRHTIQVNAVGVTDEAMDSLRKKVFVYELGDLETIARDIENIHQQIGFFVGYLSSRHNDPPASDEWREERYRQLCAEPRVQQELSRLRADQRTNP